ncbi:MAG: hypothetical protein Q8O89_03940 [Nanoarchaeota archaeon]|nr:hypothetical protein [Nanoarchaeota archaeon]
MEKSTDFYANLSKITKSICDGFKDNCLFYSEGFGFSSYDNVKGKNARPIPDGLSIKDKSFLVHNENSRDLADAIHSCEKLGRTFLNVDKNERLTVLSREFMIEGTTLPIKVTYEISGKNRRIESIYVKQSNLNRIFLGYLSHLAEGTRYDLKFSESSVVEKEVKGKSLFELYSKNDVSFTPFFKRQLVHLSVLSYFCSLYDMDNGSNIIVNQKGKFEI